MAQQIVADVGGPVMSILQKMMSSIMEWMMVVVADHPVIVSALVFIGIVWLIVGLCQLRAELQREAEILSNQS